MTRKWLLTGLASLAGTAALALALLATADSRAHADKPAKSDDEPKARSPQTLPIAQVVLYSSGVGYFAREGEVHDNARIDLTFDAHDVNDLLKSMVVQDFDGGHINAVSYDSNAPIERTLQSFAINLTGNPTFAQILTQARGEKVEVVQQQGAAAQPATLTGTVVGLERQKVAAGKDTIETEVLNLWCADGLRALKLSEVQRVRFLNPVLDGEFKKALETLALSHDTQKKAVSLTFSGEGKRNVRVSYVVENPIWKTSYRLVLDKTKKAAPFLQGWAIVENPTDEDWKDVRMALVSGRPISFQMNLYDPLYIKRPVVEPELFASLRPVAYSGSLDDSRDPRLAGGLGGPGDSPDSEKRSKGGKPGQGRGGEKKDVLSRDGDGKQNKALEELKKLDERMDLGGSTRTMATATKLGDFFQYLLDRPVTLPRQKSAMLPIVNKDVEASRVSIYNERTQAKFPLLGLKFKNSSGLHLMQGPITVFEGSSYAGDARILDLQPNEERLISYAVDLGTEVDPQPATSNGRLTEVKVVNGVVWTTTKVREARIYKVHNRNDAERTVLIEHPVRHEFVLVDTDKPAETASDVYRFQLKVAPGKTESKTITEERTLGEQVRITNFNDNQLQFFISQTVVSQKVKDGLKQAMALRFALQKAQQEVSELERQLKVITDDQARLRANLREMPSTAAAYKRYLEKFDKQEVEIEKLQGDIEKQRKVVFNQNKEFEDYLNHFSAN